MQGLGSSDSTTHSNSIEIPEQFPTSPRSAGPTGYARSKWVVEKLVEYAGSVGVEGGVFRIGQMSGDSVKCVLLSSSK